LRASPSSTSAGLRQQWRNSLQKPRPRRTSAASCWCELSHTGCRKSPLAGCACRGSASSAKIAQQFKQNRSSQIRRLAPELKPGTRLLRENGKGRTYDVLVLDDGFSWQKHALPLAFRPSRERSPATAWSGPLFFGFEAEPARHPPIPRKCREAGRADREPRLPRADASRRRLARIYTRKSSEEGLEQEFNSLAAQV